MRATVLVGHVLPRLGELPDESIQSVVTSPPYWGLRNYGVEGQLGLEKTPGEYIAKMVAVFCDVRRVLRSDGTLWLNMGDCYATGAGKVGLRPGGGDRGDAWASGVGPMTSPNRMPIAGLKSKDLVGMPWRLAFALQEDGWYLRQDIIWSKPNPMPESVQDRCTKAHEYLFLLTKSERYFFDQEAIKEDCSEGTNPRRAGNGWKTPDGWDTTSGAGGHGSFHKAGLEDGQTGYLPKGYKGSLPGRKDGPGQDRRGSGDRGKRHLPGNKTHKGTTAYENGDQRQRTKAGLVDYATKVRKLAESGSGTKNNESFDAAMAIMPEKRNKRSVWTICTQGYSEAHFATFPEALVEPCILAGSREGDTVLDPFGGSGTTAAVALRYRRNAVLIELNPEYADLAVKRISKEAPMFNTIEVNSPAAQQDPALLPTSVPDSPALLLPA